MATAPATTFVGIVNLTTDSFSDGGRFVEPAAAIEQGERLLGDGAGWLDLGAESSNPAGVEVPTDEQLRRLLPVLRHFVAAGVRVSIDTHRPQVMRAVLAAGAGMINDITALGDPEAVNVLRDYDAPIVLMYARQRGPRAQQVVARHHGIVEEIAAFFRGRIDELGAAGISRERLMLDPGMGFFLGSNAEPSLAVLRGLGKLVRDPALQRPIYVSCSRKSFVGNLTGRPPEQRGPGTLAAELWAIQAQVAYLRTHDIRAIADASRVWAAIEAMPA